MMLFLQLGPSAVNNDCCKVLFYFLLLSLIGSFWSMSTVMAMSADLICSRIPGLTARQRRMCSSKPDAMVAISSGAKLGLAECQQQFQYHRWNCSAVGGHNGFGHVVLVGSREAAYLYAVWSAAITYSISQACSRGAIYSCGCDMSKHAGGSSADSGGWKWGGCSADVVFGASLAKRFCDSREMEGDARSLMNLHNNRAGRKMVKMKLEKNCKCHGVSGSCTVKTCWQKLPPFRHIGDELMQRYRDAKAVVAKQSRSRNDSKARKLLKLQLRKRSHRKPRDSGLVYLQKSPNYCDADPVTGSLGVAGRQCNRTSSGADGCNLMCCGRGYNTHQMTRVSHQCNCKFIWCCQVKCRTCVLHTEEFTCK